jgi:hypothetical protein
MAWHARVKACRFVLGPHAHSPEDACSDGQSHKDIKAGCIRAPAFSRNAPDIPVRLTRRSGSLTRPTRIASRS